LVIRQYEYLLILKEKFTLKLFISLQIILINKKQFINPTSIQIRPLSCNTRIHPRNWHWQFFGCILYSAFAESMYQFTPNV